MTMLRPFFSFYGSKWRLAPKYPEPKYETIIEPFAGSAGYALHYPERQVILVERDPKIAAVWRYLVSAQPADILSLPRLKRGESIDDYDNLLSEERWLMGLWINQAGAYPRRTVTKFGERCQRHERVAGQLRHIRHWVIVEGSYRQAPNVSATWFVDPPYRVAGHWQYRFGPKTIDYDHLADWCRTRQGQTMVCENAGSDWLPFFEFATQQGMTDKGKIHTSKEVVWLNDTDAPDRRLAA
jgi:site-specific DNA-adenine methylase